MDKKLLKDILLLQNEQIKDKNIQRKLLKKIDEFKDTNLIIIISGIRRCGKSTLLQEIRTKNCYYVNFDDDRFFDFTHKDFQTLYELLMELFGEKHIFLFDEIQNIVGWERFVRRLHDEKKKVYVTGSNASMLSRELGTHLTGRNIAFSLFPFSFSEFLEFKGEHLIPTSTSKDKSKLKRLFNEYILSGGFPEYLITQKDEYLKSVYENILFRDIITRYKLPSEKALKETVYYAASNIGKELSFNTIKKLTGLTSATTIKEYFAYLENSYLVFLISRYDFSLKKQIYYNKKVYFIDSALARIVGFRTSEDVGRILENIVFLKLKQLGSEIYFHKQNFECDFIIREGANIISVMQVTYSLSNNKEREFNGLIEAMETHNLKEGLIITYDEEDVIDIEGKKITIIPIWKWCLQH